MYVDIKAVPTKKIQFRHEKMWQQELRKDRTLSPRKEPNGNEKMATANKRMHMCTPSAT